jgi:hypothetical protein
LNGCCWPNPAHWINDCYALCEIPQERIETDNWEERIAHSFGSCVSERRPEVQENGTTIGRREGGGGGGVDGVNGWVSVAGGFGFLGVGFKGIKCIDVFESDAGVSKRRVATVEWEVHT